MDTRLSLGERVRLRLHLAICGACRQFSRQVQILRSAARQLARREKGTGPVGAPSGATDIDRA